MNPPPKLPDLPFVRRTLANGLDVIVRRQPRLPIVAVNLWYHVGSKNEGARQRGFAHLFEHLMFEGSEHYPGDFFKPLQRLGAGINGSTSSDRTNYFVDLPAAHVELALAMESDRMGHFLPALDDHKLRVQKDVVTNEYRQNYENRPYGSVSRLMAEALYPPGHPYRWLTIGAMEDVEAATRADVEAFFRRFYVPNNASLCIVGDVEESRALDLAERYFGDIHGGAPALRPTAPKAVGPGSHEITLREPVELDRVYLSWPTVPHFDPDDAPLDLVGDVLARGRASRLYRRLVVEEELAQDVTAYQSGRELAGAFGVVVTLRPGRDPKAARIRVAAELADLAARGPSPEELERARNGRLAGFLYAMDNVGGFGGVADRFNAYNTYLGDPAAFTADFARFAGATSEKLAAAARRYLAADPSVALTVLGRSTSGRKPDTAPVLDRSARPGPAPAIRFRAPRPEVIRLRSGASLWAIPARDLPIVAASAVVPAGATAHPPGRAGLAALTASMLDEGTLGRSAEAIASLVEGMGAHLGVGAGWDGSYASFHGLANHLEAGLDLAADVLHDPSFPEAEFDRVKALTLAGLRADRDRADALASMTFLDALYGSEHPYGRPADGTEATVSDLTRGDLVAFHAGHYLPDGSAWVVAGDFDPETVARVLDERIAPRRGAVAPPPPPEPPDDAPGPRIVLVHRPGAPQAVVRVGHVGIPRKHPDYDALALWNQVLGGQFTSRLNGKLREEKGYTYGVRSHFDARRGAGPFAVSASLEQGRLAEALADLKAEIEALMDDRPPTSKELDDARRALVEGQARHFESPSALVSRYAGLFLQGLPPDHHAGLADRLGVVTVADAETAAARHVLPETFLAVVVADADRVLAPLEALGWGPVVRAEADRG